VLEQPMTGATAVLVRNVIALRAEYGVSASGGTTLQSWQDPTDSGWGSLTANNIGRVRALRLGVVTRVPQQQKPEADGTCTASEAKPRLFEMEIEPDVSNWRCFRYRSSTLVVPLRNLVWGQVPA
jgi:type IV pilus assembly protein PilW